MRIVLPKGAGMQEISFLCEEIRTLILLILLSINVRVSACFKNMCGISFTRKLSLECSLTHCNEDVETPHTRHQVKHAKLTRLIKLGVLALGEVKTSVHFLQHEP